MAFKTIESKYASKCRRCGGDIAPGTRIRWAKGAGSYHLKQDCPAISDDDREAARVAAAQRAPKGPRPETGEQSERRYWERVDSYRENGFAPDYYDGGDD